MHILGDRDVKCTMMFMLNHEPSQFKLEVRLARLLGVHTATRSTIIHSLWQYIKKNKLQVKNLLFTSLTMLKQQIQDHNDRIWINLDPYLRQIFMTDRIRFADIPGRLHPLLTPPGEL